MKNYGFIKPVIESGHLFFGSALSLDKHVIQADGQWDKWLPVYEAQAELYETYGCTVWGTLNATEIIEKKLTGTEVNHSERYIYNTVPVRPPGADPHAVADAIREAGLIKQELLPMPETFAEFCTPTPPTAELLKEGSLFLDKYNFGHEWLFTENVSKEVRVSLMKEALQYSPLGVSVTAWYEEDGVYVDRGMPNTHWCVCYGYTEANGQVFWKIFDSYDHSEKLLHPDHHIEFSKRYSLVLAQALVQSVAPQSWLSTIISWLKMLKWW